MFIWCVGLLFIKGFFCLKITTPSEINATLESNSSIPLNCKYEKETNDKILNIQWKKETSHGNYKELVYAVKEDAYYSAGGFFLKNRSELHGFGNGSTSVILTIKDLRCIDNGQYQCSVQYIDGSGLQATQTTNTVVYIQADAKKPTVFSITQNGRNEEHEMVKLSCVGEVGNPPGFLAIWRMNQTSNTSQLLEKTSAVNSDVENCTHIVNLTTNYNLTRDDNGAEFSCSSQNLYTTDPGPSTDIGPIEVLYGPSIIRIEATFSDSQPFIGDTVFMDCISDGNPYPNFTWKFNLTDVVSDGKYSFSVNRSRLSFTITNITDSGYYQCVASNIINGKTFNNSSNITLRVREKNNGVYPSYIEQTCSENPCLIIENCVLTKDKENCVVNIWSVIAFLFIALTFILCTTTFSLAISRIKEQKKDNIKKGFHIDDVQVSYTRETFDDFGGYADPKDVKRPEKKNKTDKDGRDNPYADPVDFQTQYAVVQKNWETPANSTNDNNSSNPPHLLNNTDTSNTGNPSSPPETINPSNEKTPDSTESSETIPKPPNVYDDAWV